MLALSRKVAPECSGHVVDPRSDGGPAQQTASADGVDTTQECGLIVKEIAAQVFITNFVKTACHGEDSDRCTGMYVDMFFARLEGRYPLADWRAISSECRAHPAECKSHETIELWALESHNTSVARWANSVEASLTAAEQERAYQEEIDTLEKLTLGAVAFVRGYLGATYPETK